jgi:hypothetical protein
LETILAQETTVLQPLVEQFPTHAHSRDDDQRFQAMVITVSR